MSRDDLRLAVGTLTRWTVRPPTRVDPGVAGRAMLWAPWVGFVLGGVAALPMALSPLSKFSPLMYCVATVALLAYLSAGLHLDGLADTADALAAGDRGLEMMRRGDVGPLGAATLMLVLAGQAAMLVAVVQLTDPSSLSGAWSVVVVAVGASRLALPLTCRTAVPAAREHGLGATVAGTVAPWALIVNVLTVTGAGVVLMIWCRNPWWFSPTLVVGALLGAQLTLRRTRSRFGGITGDTLGAGVEVALTGALLLTTVLDTLVVLLPTAAS